MTVFSPDDFSSELIAWLGQADARISVDAARWPGAFASLQGGEITFGFDRAEDGWITVSSSSRGGDAAPVFRTPSVDVLERFLANEAGPVARFLAGIPGSVRVPFRLDEIAPGATLRILSDGELGGFEELRIGDAVIGEFGFGPRGPLAHASSVRASHYATGSVADIAASYLSADGKPLFGLR